jgi:hypothetical protein
MATDPHDKIYGILSMVQRHEDQRALKVDYILSKREVLMNEYNMCY